MFRSISADFYSIEDAEVASMKINSQISGVKSVDIINNEEYSEINQYNPFSHFGLLNFNFDGRFIPYNYVNYMYEVNLNNRNNSSFNYLYNDTKRNNITLKVECNENVIDNVSKILVSLGGHNIKKV